MEKASLRIILSRSDQCLILIFDFNEKTLKQKRMVIGTKFALPYSILFLAELEEKFVKQWFINRGYGGDILMMPFSSGNMGRKIKEFCWNLQCSQPYVLIVFV